MCAASPRAIDISSDWRAGTARDGLDRVHLRHAFVQWRINGAAVPDRAHTEVAAVQSAKARECPAGTGLGQRGVLHHQHELANLRARNHDELSEPDHWLRVP